MFFLFFSMQQDTVNNLRKAQALYISRQQELERVRDTMQKAEGEKMEKRKRLEEEAMHKVTSQVSDEVLVVVDPLIPPPHPHLEVFQKKIWIVV